MTQSSPLPLSQHFMRLSISPPTADALTVRKVISDALNATFGLTSASTYVDVLWVKEDGEECVLRTGLEDVMKVLAAITSSSDSPRLSVVKESPFLPSLLCDNTPL
ncbi:hypothetical protein BDQ12DRAFT_257713 [Crucibulum laeve]|uniref:Ribonucleases P/MRP subunit Pop8-like domain-containing protein n=1 Tax=Crucibulum laeve TaxID=68775 RepID=A0A5C3LVW8_9AGAR|nr:hypothetical protein BDQ12DRAFT_257713 [Crucibulum laeve]